MADEKKKTIYEIGLGEYTTIGTFYVERVPGGWLYYRSSTNVHPVFVPLSNEFKPHDVKPFKVNIS